MKKRIIKNPENPVEIRNRMLRTFGLNTNNNLKPDEVARYLKLSVDTVIKYSRQGVIPCTRIGRIFRYNKSILDIWLVSGGSIKQNSLVELYKVFERHIVERIYEEFKDKLDRRYGI